MTLYCPECGSKLNEKSKFCPNCGKNLRKEKTKIDVTEKTNFDIKSESNVKDTITSKAENKKDAIAATTPPIKQPKNKINVKPILMIVGLIIILSIALVSADYFNLVSVGIFENKSPTLSVTTYLSTEYQPTEVTFNIKADDEDGIVKSYFIDFGDGTTSDDMNPTHTYSAGTYIAVITITDNEGAKTIKNVTVIVKNKEPIAFASCDLTNGRAPLTVSFNGSGNDSDGTIESYHWDFNDGYTSSEQKPIHTFTADKKYNVIFSVTDNDGSTATKSITITATKNNPPIASASSDKTSGEAPLTVKFAGSGTDTDGTITKYTWDFDDGKTSNSQNPTYTFTTQGKYTVVLTVTDNEGGTDTDTIEITVCKWVKIESFNEPYYLSTPYFDINTDKFRVDYEIIPEEGTYSFPMAIFGIYPLGATWVGDTCIYMKGTSINSDNLTGTLIAYKSGSYVETNSFRCDLDLPYDIEEYNVDIYEWRCE